MKITHRPEIDYVSIDFKAGVEAKSYFENGVIVRLDGKGNVIGLDVTDSSRFFSGDKRATKNKNVEDLTDKELESSLSRGEWRERGNAQRGAAFKAAAQAHLENKRKEGRINLRVSDQDLMSLRQIAEREGIGYQTLIASIIHKYAVGEYLDRRTVVALLGENVVKKLKTG